MSKLLIKLYTFSLYENGASCLGQFVRKGHHLRGKPPGIAKSLEEKLKEMQFKDPKLHFKVDIGLPIVQQNRTKVMQERMELLKKQRSDAELEKLSRKRQLLVDLEESNKDWLKTVGPQHIKRIAEHYGIFEHLFGDAYFNPLVPLNIFYVKDDLEHPVYYGNLLKPDEASHKPKVTFDGEGGLWTLVLTNPDGHLEDNEKEYVHWMVANIPGCDVDKGETIVDYLQPLPPKGTGYHRFVFVLYKQTEKLDLSNLKAPKNLQQRTFNTYDFYRNLQDQITPAGLAFFQSDYIPSLKAFFHETLQMKEPVFEYDFPEAYIRPQRWHPKRQPFNLYMDKYRDPKQINKEFLEKKLQKVHPFKVPEAPLLYPNAEYIDKNVPSWLKLQMRKERMKWGRINDIE